MNPILEQDFGNIIKRVGPKLFDLRAKTLLLTGYSGFLGAYIVEFLAYCNENYFAEKVRVVGMDNYVAGERNRLEYLRDAPGLDLRFADVAQDWYLKHLHTIDYVIHAASIAAPEFYKQKPLETISANVTGTWNVLEKAAKVGIRSMVHLSSSEAYGEPTIIPTPETDPGNVNFVSARGVYDESKRMGETLCWVFHNKYKLPVKIVRPFNVMGPGQRLDDGRVIPNLMKSLLNDEPFIIYGDGSSTRSYCYISDAVTQLFSVLFNGENGEAYNLGCENEVSLASLVEIANAVFDGRPAIEIRAAPEQVKDAPKRRRPDLSKIHKFVPRAEVELEEGLRRTYEYYRI